MKNIHVLPTDKPSRLFLNKVNKKIILEDISNPNLKKVLPSGSYQHIYITSDVEITGFENNIWVIKGERIFLWQNTMALVSNNKPKKIILTTDQDLIKDGVQAIDDEFLQWYVKNPSCEYVEVSEDYFKLSNMVYGHNTEHYKIIIPKEPKTIHQQIIYIVGGEDRFREIANLKPKQETFEEAGKYFIENTMKYCFTSSETKTVANRLLKCIEFGAKWQQERMYSEEDLKEGFRSNYTPFSATNTGDFDEDFDRWFKQFKKK
jgi:hypothetical protein